MNTPTISTAETIRSQQEMIAKLKQTLAQALQAVADKALEINRLKSTR